MKLIKNAKKVRELTHRMTYLEERIGELQEQAKLLSEGGYKAIDVSFGVTRHEKKDEEGNVVPPIPKHGGYPDHDVPHIIQAIHYAASKHLAKYPNAPNIGRNELNKRRDPYVLEVSMDITESEGYLVLDILMGKLMAQHKEMYEELKSLI